jgi:hypothetical protein
MVRVVLPTARLVGCAKDLVLGNSWCDQSNQLEAFLLFTRVAVLFSSLFSGERVWFRFYHGVAANVET